MVAHWGDTDMVVLVVTECAWLFSYSVILAHIGVLLWLHNLSAALLGWAGGWGHLDLCFCGWPSVLPLPCAVSGIPG